MDDRRALALSALSTWDRSSTLEWLVTNGIGGYASGTLAGASTRRYHGFLVAALSPPLGRTVLVAHVEETILIEGEPFPLSSSQWRDGSVSPCGFERLKEFRLEDGLPVFTYDVAGHQLEKRVWMDEGVNQTRASYEWPEDAPPALLSVKLFLTCRDYHAETHGSPDWPWRSGQEGHTAWFSPGDAGPRILVTGSPFSRFLPENLWYWGFLHNVERERGLDDTEDLWVPGSLGLLLCPGGTAGLTASVGDSSEDSAQTREALEKEQRRRRAVVQEAPLSDTGLEAAVLAAAADAFLVRRAVTAPGGGTGGAAPGVGVNASGKQTLPDQPDTIIAGYHWFGDWGRDTMISMPGLALTCARRTAARQILSSYAGFVSEGMLPNRFPDSSAAPEYNTVDATLWYFVAIHRYVEQTGDQTLVDELLPCLEEIVKCHIRGTRHGIGMDPADGLLRAGETGVQLTWMDAKVGDWVVTPRIGKPVEIQALWRFALQRMAEWSITAAQDYAGMSDRVRESFVRKFWRPGENYLCDVVDGPDGDDASFRPNQLFALSLPAPLLTGPDAVSVLEQCESRLLTPCGLRTLDPKDPRYVGIYEGDQGKRDGAYHQGTVWPWLIGPYVDAVLEATGDRMRAQRALAPILEQLGAAGIGTLSEIYDGDPPHRPRGCIAQAWSVGEALRALAACYPISDGSA